MPSHLPVDNRLRFDGRDAFPPTRGQQTAVWLKKCLPTYPWTTDCGVMEEMSCDLPVDNRLRSDGRDAFPGDDRLRFDGKDDNSWTTDCGGSMEEPIFPADNNLRFNGKDVLRSIDRSLMGSKDRLLLTTDCGLLFGEKLHFLML
jgi:hypothetical protein